MSADLLRNFGPQPDPSRSRRNYAALAAGYDASCHRIERLRAQAIATLALLPGEHVLDVACGSGATLATLACAVGPSGRVTGVEHSPEMAALARDRARVASARAPTEVIEAAVESLPTGLQVDAMLLSYTHDVLQSEAAVDRLLACARPGARLSILGMKTLPWLWGWPVNAFNLYRARRYLTTYSNLDRPWQGLSQRGLDVRVVATGLMGSAYLATTTTR
jgi:ubiquinone/menaquinone biosynthesis C-methylase UbiE